MPIRHLLLAATALSLVPAAHAQEDRLEALERRLAEQQARIDQLEAMVAKQSRMLEQAPVTAPSSPPDVAASVPASPPVPGAAPAPAQLADATPQADGAFRIPGLDVSGDVRVRQEWNFVPGRDRSRLAVRARLQASYAIDRKSTR